MKRILYLSLLTLIYSFATLSAYAEVRLPKIVSSNMVLQRDATVALWGWADAGEQLTIKTSWLAKELKLTADKQGTWRVDVKTTNSKSPQTIEIKSKTSEIKLDNILFGEVWLCSGQSNMEQPVKGFSAQPTYGGLMATAKSSNPNLRLFTVGRAFSVTPLADLEKGNGWQVADPDQVSEFSAVGYFFAQQLQEILDVPVGVIHTSWGGSKVEAWMSQEVLGQYEEVALDGVDLSDHTQWIPTVLFNAMVYPLMPFTIKGVLWYQGESNRRDPERYKSTFPAMVKDWRSRWGLGDFPFYYVQIAPYRYKANGGYQTPDNSAFIREAQLQCLDSIPNSGIAITMDVGDSLWIHPPKKKEVADRLLFNALNQTYGFKSVDHASPVYESQEISEGSILLSFAHAETGLYAYGPLSGFEIAGADHVFYPAQAQIVDRMKVEVQSDQVPAPVAVRYAWRNWVEGTLFDTNLLPASSFRTDNWTAATRAGE
ncbi:sialate O-acetylesterase [Reichenbachiella carrageenanivorans]|uniref:Sialate O-acetylesterase n=1 Tax=Reichenbachiella carrageenanivorans TaxID=2979869 RepID=A0ABY6CZ37_9BACT|nr:sialate O-acetylesterase [Reichenbachiella carrageenanivorans]UXX79176.1 sialate O-acetylesterase [Reichenbachiella carrageenanivorans]